MEFFRHEYWSGVPFPPPGDRPYLGIEPTMSPVSPALGGGFLTTSTTGDHTQSFACLFLPGEGFFGSLFCCHLSSLGYIPSLTVILLISGLERKPVGKSENGINLYRNALGFQGAEGLTETMDAHMHWK